MEAEGSRVVLLSQRLVSSQYFGQRFCSGPMNTIALLIDAESHGDKNGECYLQFEDFAGGVSHEAMKQSL